MTPYTSGQCLVQMQTIAAEIASYSFQTENVRNGTDSYSYQVEIDALMKKYKFFENMYNKAVNEENGTQDTMGYLPRYEYGI